MSSWVLWFWFSKVLWGNVFLKKHAMSKVFQNFYGQSAFFELFFSEFSDKLGSRGMIHTGRHRPRIQNLRFWYFLFTLIFKRMSFFKTVLWLVFHVLWLVLHVLHTRSSDHGPLFLPLVSSYSPTHKERRRRDLWNNKISIEIKCSGIEDALMKPATSKATIYMKITLEEMAGEV